MDYKLIRKQIEFFIQIVGGRVFTAEFIKKDGTKRVMNCRLGVTKGLKGGAMRWSPIDKGCLSVYDMQKRAYRIINFKTLQKLIFNGKTWEF
jgi:hypothetical protein